VIKNPCALKKVDNYRYTERGRNCPYGSQHIELKYVIFKHANVKSGGNNIPTDDADQLGENGQ